MKGKPETYTCGLGPALDVVGGKWKALMLWEVNTKTRRFGELKRLLPAISEKMLIQQLRELEVDGIIHRESFHEVPPRVEYSATPLGAELNEVLTPLGDWGEKHKARILAVREAQTR